MTVPCSSLNVLLQKSADHRPTRLTKRPKYGLSGGERKQTPPIPRREERAAEQQRNRHWPHAARHGRQPAGDVGHAGIDVADGTCSVRLIHIDDSCARLDHLRGDQTRPADGGHGVARRVAGREIRRPRVADCHGGVRQQRCSDIGLPTISLRPTTASAPRAAPGTRAATPCSPRRSPGTWSGLSSRGGPGLPDAEAVHVLDREHGVRDARLVHSGG